MRIRRTAFSTLFSFALLLGLSQAAFAAPEPQAANKTVEAFAEEMWGILQSGQAEAERKDKLAATIAKNTDTTLLGRLALGRHWRELSDDQKKRFDDAFPTFVTHMLASRLMGAAGDIDGAFNETFQILDGEAVSDEDVVVRTEIAPTGGRQPVTVDWRLRETDGELAIIDLSIDQVSLLVSQRNEFAAVIERGSIDDLLAQLENPAKA